MSANHSRRLFYSGRVQGVGFRYTVKQIASGYEVVGWVRNLADGRVEVEVSGNRSEVAAFAEAIARSQLGSHIRKVEETEVELFPNDCTGFEIRH